MSEVGRLANYFMKQYYPKRNRGVYRAAANHKSKLNAWSIRLIESLKSGTVLGILRWVYRNTGDFCIKDLVYTENPLLSLISKVHEEFGAYIPVPLKHGNDEND